MRKTVILFFLVSVLGVAGLHAQTAVGIRDTVYACDRYVWPVSGHTYTEGRGLTAPVDTVCQGDTCRMLYLVLGRTVRLTVSDTIVENDLPYTYRGQQFFDYTRNYPITIHAADSRHCDSIISYSLYVFWNVYSYVDSTVCENQLPLQWLHRTFTSAGTRRDTVPNVHGADSMLTMTLRVLHNSRSTYYDTVVERQLPWTFHDHVATGDENGVNIVIPNAIGCDSIISYNLYVYRNLSRSHDTTVCESVLPFVWYGRRLSQAGTYVDTLLRAGIHGEDSVITLNLAVAYRHANIIRDTIVENQLPKRFLDTVFYAPTLNNEFVIRDGSICDSLIVYSLHVYYNVYDTADTNICNTSLPFTWNGHRFVGTGGASVTLTAQHGEDSILWMNVYVHTQTRSTVYDTIVESQLPWTFNGQVIHNGGTSLVVIPNNGGCDSLIIYYLYVYPNTHIRVDSNICADQLPLDWNGMLFTEGGIRSFAYPAANGADSIVEYNLIVHQNNDIYDTYTACDTFVWREDGRRYTASTRNAYVAYTNRWGCDSVVHLHLTLGRTTTRYDVQEACDSYRWIDRREYTESVRGPQVVTTNASGCDSIIILDLTIHYSVQVTLEVTTHGVYIWNGEIYRESGYITGHFTTVHGCDSTVTIDLTIIPEAIDEAADEPELVIYPNPTSGKVEIKGAEVSRVEVLDIVGRSVATYTNRHLDLSSLPAGNYVMRITTPTGVVQRHLLLKK